jgi:hypothetical protein
MPGPRSIAVWLIVAIAAAVLGGCEEAPMTMATHRVDDPWSFAWGAIGNRPLLVEINGTPFDAESGRVEAVVVAAMTGVLRQRNASAAVTTDPGAAGSRTLRLVITFNGRSGLSGLDQCLGRAQGGEPLPRGYVWMVLTFCDFRSVLASVSGRVGGVRRPDDRQFAALVRQATGDLFDGQHRP